MLLPRGAEENGCGGGCLRAYEPTTGLHPTDVEKLIVQLHGLVDAGNTVITVEHDMRVVAASDWLIDIGPGAGRRAARWWRRGRRARWRNRARAGRRPI